MSLAPPARYLAAAAILATVAGALVAAPAGAATTTTTTALPQITALSSTSGDTSCGSSVTLTGQNLDGANQVLFGSVQAGFQVLSPNKLSVYVPAHGKAKVAVMGIGVASISALKAAMQPSLAQKLVDIDKSCSLLPASECFGVAIEFLATNVSLV